MRPEISIVMPAFNNQAFIALALHACIRQANLVELPHEVVIVNDGSTDRTRSILHKYEKNTPKGLLRVYDQDNNGIAHATNRAFEESHGKTIVMVDADDIIKPQALALLYEVHKKGQYPITVGQHRGFDSKTGQTLFTTHKQNFQVVENDPAKEPLLHMNTTGHPKMISKNRIEAANGLSVEAGITCDFDLVQRLLFPGLVYQFGLIDKVLYDYRIHKQNTTSIPHFRASGIKAAEATIDKTLKRLGISGKCRNNGRTPIGYLNYVW